MVVLAEKAFTEGAIGLSFGLEYAPGSSFEEIVALSQVAAKYGRLIAIHTRMLSCGDLASLVEAVNIGKITGGRVLLSHFVYQYGCGLMREALAIVDEARQNGLDIWLDSGMYTAFASFVGTPVFSEKYMAEFGWKPEDLMAATGKYCGRRLTRQLYEEMRNQHLDESVICFTGNEIEIYEPFSRDYAMVSSDIGPTPSGSTREGHPQNAGTFPRFFRKLVREKHSLSLNQAVAKCTLLPADTLGLTGKGQLTEGADADLVIWDSDRITDRADFPGIGSPDAPPEGITHVIVSGQIAVMNNRIIQGVLSGKTIPINPTCNHGLSQAG
jgi:N-acyl-D-amino-acid deacylase